MKIAMGFLGAALACASWAAGCGSANPRCDGDAKCTGPSDSDDDAGDTTPGDGDTGASDTDATDTDGAARCGQAFCDFLGAECGSVVDECGDTTGCGTCTSGVCNSSTLTCDCVPESNADFCIRQGKDCGSVSTNDNCGAPRVTNCGACADVSDCGRFVSNVCAAVTGCAPETDQELCDRWGAECAAFSATDSCGTPRNADCGTCSGPYVCVTAENRCCAEATAAFCKRVGKNCGIVSGTNVCGQPIGPVICGSCGATCSANVCQVGESDAQFCARWGKNCGSLTATDEFGASRTAACGTCGVAGETCVDNVCTPSCAAESDADFCQRLGKNCGSVSGTDNCGQARTADCGTCAVGSCGDSTANVCSQGNCVAETDPAFCSRWGATCGPLDALDNCGVQRQADCGACP